MQDESGRRLIGQQQLREYLGGISEMTLWRWRDSGGFPQPIQIQRRNYYYLDEVDGWLAKQPRRLTSSRETA